MPFIPFAQLPGQFRDQGFIDASLIRGGQITAQEIILAGGTQGIIRSQNYDGSNTGWAIFGDGSASFYGDVTLGANAILTGDFYADAWDGAIPIDLSGTYATGIDATATAGFAFDSSEGRFQITDIVWIGSGASGDFLAFEANQFSVSSGIDFFRGGDPVADIYAAGDDENNSTLFIRNQGDAGGGSAVLSVHNTTNQTDGLGFTFDKPVGIGIGSAGSPTLTFTDDADTGMYRVAADRLGFTLGGTHVAEFNGGKLRTATSATGSPEILFGSSTGSATAPVYSFQGDSDTGFYREAANSIGVALGGIAFNIRSDGTFFWFEDDGAVGNRFVFDHVNEIRADDGAASDPSYTFQNAQSSGLYATSTTAFAATAGGEARMSWAYQSGAGTGVYIHEDLTDVGNHETLRADRTGSGSGLTEIGYFSSWQFDPVTGKRAKVRIKPLKPDLSIIDEVRPISFKRVSTKEHEWGFRLEDFKERDEEWRYLTTKGDKWGYSPHEIAFIAVLWESNRDLRRRVATLEARIEKLEALVG